jgi:hypothetical protein
MNDAGRAVFDNSMARRAFEEASLIVSVIKNNPEQAKYYAKNTGWTYSLNGDNVDTLTSPDGKWVFTANEEGMHKLMGDIQKTLMDDITAARIKGTDAQSIPEASAKVMLNNQKFLQVYGTPGNAYHALRSFMDQKVMLKDGSMKDLFTPSQKMIHATSVTLDAAIEDNAFSQAEMAALSAQFVPTVKQFGGEVIWGQGVDDTQIIMRNNGMTRTYPIREFANLLRQRDVITPAFNQHVAEVARRMKLNQAAEQGANAAVTPMTPEEKQENEDLHIQTYGANWARLSKEKKQEVIAAENGLIALAYVYGLAARSSNGELIAIEPDEIVLDKHYDNIKIMADEEKRMLGEYDLPATGYWNRMLEKAEKQQEAVSRGKEMSNYEETEARRRNVYNLAPSSPKTTYKTMEAENNDFMRFAQRRKAEDDAEQDAQNEALREERRKRTKQWEN